MRLLYLLPLILLLASCRSTRIVSRETVKIDSTRTDSLRKIVSLQESQIKTLEKVLKDSSGVTVIYEPSDTVYVPGKVTIDRNGVLQAEGRLKSVQVSNTRLQQDKERVEQEKAVLTDSIRVLNETLSKKEVRVDKQVERRAFIPWWVWVVLAVTGAVAIFKERIPVIKHLKI